MSEIEKMYENAGVEKEVIPCPAKYYGYDCTRNNWDDEDCSCDIEGYPPFTAEKQLALIKWLINEIDYISLWHFKNPEAPYDFDLGRYHSTGLNFEEALAGLINDLWQDLTETEKAEIKRILE